jgi:hypothetical protein
MVSEEKTNTTYASKGEKAWSWEKNSQKMNLKSTFLGPLDCEINQSIHKRCGAIINLFYKFFFFISDEDNLIVGALKYMSFASFVMLI